MGNAADEIPDLVPEQDDRRIRHLDVERALEGPTPVRQQRHLAVEAHAVVGVPLARAAHELHHAAQVGVDALALQIELVGHVEDDAVGVLALVDGRVDLQHVDEPAFARPHVHDVVVVQRRAAQGIDLDARPVRHERGRLLLARKDKREGRLLHVGRGEHHPAIVVQHPDVDLDGRVAPAVGFDVERQHGGPDRRAAVVLDDGVRELQVKLEVDAAAGGPSA